MVFKNPYGYLIKNFKLIHLILTALFVYLAFKVSSILQYYNLFIEGTASKLDAMSYVTSYYMIAIVLSIAICIIIYFLMRYKKKPRLLYLLLIGLYIVVTVIIRISYSGLNDIAFSLLDSKNLRLYRDLLRIIIVFQYISIALVLVRGLGFDVKKFDFVKDLEDLQLNEHDQEEIEVALGGTESLQRKFNRRLRELRYYYLENRPFILLIAVIVIVLFLGSVYLNKEVVNKVYSEGEVFATEEFRFNVLNTFVTNRDYKNSIISTETSFVIVKISLGTNRSIREFETSNLLLKINNNSYSVNSRYSSKFLDLGVAYKGGKISKETTFLFIYQVNNSEINSQMRLEYAGNKVVKLSPIYLDQEKSSKDYSVGSTIDWSDTIFSSGSFKISSFEVKNKFSYDYQYEAYGKTNTASISIDGGDRAIMKLVIDTKLPFDSSLYDFLSKFSVLKYKVGEEEFTSYFTDKTPGSYKDGVYLLVDSNMLNASNIWFDISIRSYKYHYVLK